MVKLNSKIVKSVCFECHCRCGVLLEVKDGRLVGLKGDKGHPFSHGFVCPKGKAIMELIYHPERITKPLLKVGKRGDGKFESASWDKALNIIAERLLEIRQQFGAESLVIGTGTTRGIPPNLSRFLTLFGSPNYMSPSNMSGFPMALGNIKTCGFVLAGPDYGNSRCIVLWAHNPEQSFSGLYMYDIRKALREGAKLIVIDPRGTRLAQKADHWLQLRPGTDVALALCFINIIIENELYDKEFVKKWTVGFERLREHVSSFTVHRCAEITWVPKDIIKAAALTFADTKPACIGPGLGGVCQANDAFDLNRALTILIAITGNLEAKGGSPNYRPPTGNRQCYGSDFDVYRNLSEQQAKKKLSLDNYPLLSSAPIPAEIVWRAISEKKPYPVKAIGLFANNSMCAFASSQHVKKALEELEFLFAVDYFHTPTTQLADVILPPAHWTERDDVEDLFMKSYLFCQPKAIEPVPDCRCEKQILIDLAERLGLEGYWETVEESLDYRLEPIGMTYEKFKKVGKINKPVIYKSYEKRNGFLTPSRKVELYSEHLESMGISPLPVFREPSESPATKPELWKEYPLILTTGGRNVVYYHSAHRNIKSLRKNSPDPELQINPHTAEELDLEEGQWVWLVTPRGKVEIKVSFFKHIHPKIVHAPHGYWYGVINGWRRLNINMITNNQDVDPVTASPSIKAMLCRIEKLLVS
jgi:anaerobic selenocysteine-containing dehydrogenase